MPVNVVELALLVVEPADGIGFREHRAESLLVAGTFAEPLTDNRDVAANAVLLGGDNRRCGSAGATSVACPLLFVVRYQIVASGWRPPFAENGFDQRAGFFELLPKT